MVQVYTQIGEMLTRYKSGKLPKAIKILPMIDNWEELLYLTQPESTSILALFLLLIIKNGLHMQRLH